MSKIESGTIFKFNVPFNLGVAYAKMVNFSQLSMYDGITIKVYDYFIDKEINDVGLRKKRQIMIESTVINEMYDKLLNNLTTEHFGRNSEICSSRNSSWWNWIWDSFQNCVVTY
jgi:hypothetical protein